MTRIKKSEVEKIAKLSRLCLSPGEVEEFTGQLDAILGYFDQINEVDTTGIDPTSHAIPMDNVFRDDVVHPSVNRDDILRNVPDPQDGFIRVPKIIEH